MFLDRYGPNGTFWATNPSLNQANTAIHTIELYNEPYFNSGSDYDPTDYAHLVKAADIAATGVDASVTVLIPAEMAGTDTSSGWVWWVNALYAAEPDLNKYFTAVAMHDYGNDTTNLSPMVTGQAYPNFGRTLRIWNLRRQFVMHGAVMKPFWITEMGWSTCSGDPDCVTPAQQNTNMQTFLTDVNTVWSGFVRAVFPYDYQDGATDPTAILDGYGLVELDGSAKPSLATFEQEETLAGS